MLGKLFEQWCIKETGKESDRDGGGGCWLLPFLIQLMTTSTSSCVLLEVGQWRREGGAFPSHTHCALFFFLLV